MPFATLSARFFPLWRRPAIIFANLGRRNENGIRRAINPAGPIHSPGNCCPSTPPPALPRGLSSVLTEKVRRLDSGSAAQPEGGTHPSREILHLAHTLLSLYRIYEETRAEFQTPSEPASSAAPVVANQAPKTSSKPVVRDLTASDPRLARIWGVKSWETTPATPASSMTHIPTTGRLFMSSTSVVPFACSFSARTTPEPI